MIRNIKSVLAGNEAVLHDSRVHWVVFSAPVFYAVIGLAVGIFFHPLVGGVILLMDLYPAYIATVFYLTTHLVLTNKKILGRTGFLSRNWTQLNLNRIETAYLQEPLAGRWMGYSSVIVRGTGAGSIAFPYIINGDVFVKKLEKLLAQREDQEQEKASVIVLPPPPAPAAASPDTIQVL